MNQQSHDQAVDRLRSELGRKIKGDLLFDEMSRRVFSTDASLYQITPTGVVLPRNRFEVVQTVRTAAKHGISILPRGGGTSLAGQTVNAGLVVDCSKYMSHVLSFDRAGQTVTVEPGIVLDNLNDYLRFHEVFFAPDVATSSRATIGGMCGNNSAGVRSIRYGKTVDKVEELTVVLATGEEMTFGSLSRPQLAEKCALQDREGEIYRGVTTLIGRHRDEIERRFPKVMRRVGGYNLDYLLDENSFNLAKLLVGSEGTLAFALQAKLKVDPIPASRMVCVVHFDDLIKAVDAVEPILAHGPSAVEIIDPHGLRLARQNPTVAKLCGQFLQGMPEAVLIVEFSDIDEEIVLGAADSLKSDPRVSELSYALFEAWSSELQEVVWQVRKNALGVLLSVRGDAKPLPFIEDACIPVRHLSRYIRQILEMCRRHGREVALYAHASVGVIHVRPILNLKQAEDVRIMEAISEETFDLVRQYQGAWSGEHGDGLVRSYKNREFFGDQLYQAFRDIKQLFDPENLMNPGKIVDSDSMSAHLRIHPDYHPQVPPTHFRFSEDQGFDRAIEMCTGVGQCRKTLSGTMCPSYMATRDEEHSTRGRANALRSAIAGDLGIEGFTSQRLFEVMDLCLECKACKSECPSNVDMARLKAEFLSHYYDRHGLPLGKRLVSELAALARLGSRMPALTNWIGRNPLVRRLMEKRAGLDRRRSLPQLAERSFGRLVRSHRNDDRTGADVALFVDTFTNYFQPEVGLAAIQVLDAIGLRSLSLELGCCGRPLVSSGRLSEAASRGAVLLEKLAPIAREGLPIVVLEPSCLAVLLDDLPDLAPNPEVASALRPHLYSLEQLLALPVYRSRLEEKLNRSDHRVLLHGHCQQKALWGIAETTTCLGLAGDEVQPLDAGCCGMAGSFGYEKSHYGLSEKIGRRRLFPAVEKASPGDICVAPGFSCRCQLEHFTGRQALHPAQYLASLIRTETH